MLNRKKYFNHSHLKTNAALRINFHAHYIFTKISMFIYNNVQIHPNVTVQHLKSIPFVQKACNTCVHSSVSGKNQASFQTKGFMHGLVQKILDTCERVAKASCKWRDAQRAMRNRRFIGYTLGPLERNFTTVRGRPFDFEGVGGCQILFGQIIYFRHGLGRKIYFHVAWARGNLFSWKHGKPLSRQ